MTGKGKKRKPSPVLENLQQHRPQPLYLKVKKHILALIAEGRLPSDRRIPSENELVRKLNVSRMTVNRALRELAAEGILLRIQGVGTFVKPSKQSGPKQSGPKQSGKISRAGTAQKNQQSAGIFGKTLRLKTSEILLDDRPLTLEEFIGVARNRASIRLSGEARAKVDKTCRFIDRSLKEGRTIYGVTTGFGALSDVSISRRDSRRLQTNIIMSHAAGVGPRPDEEAARGVMLLRAKELSLGHACGSVAGIEQLLALLNRGGYPFIPEQGSVGASGDLCPMAHMALLLIGKGEGFFNGRRLPGRAVLDECGLKPLRLKPGEGLALINGTQVMTAIGALAVYDAVRLAKLVDIAAAMSLEVLMGSRTEFDARIQQLRSHPGHAVSAGNILQITHGSEIISSHKDCRRIQDAYTLRCSPQVHGASHDAIQYARKVIETEMNAATNNPLVFSDSGDVLLGGNFHGQPVALALDFMSMAVAELADISERRIERLVNPKLSGLPAFLIRDGGLNSGFMIAQYTAAALVSENKVLAHPACVDSIPTSANKEDHVSMGTIAARKCRNIVRNTEHVMAVELLCAAQALDLFTNLNPGKGTLAAYSLIRKHIPHMEKDRVLADDIAGVLNLIRSDAVVAAVEDTVGELGLVDGIM